MSKDLFMLMREQEVQTANFLPNKKELELSSKRFAQNLVESGEYDIYELVAQSERYKLAISEINAILKDKLPKEKHIAFGIEFSPMNGRKMIQLSDDPVWCKLKNEIDKRETLLNTALKSDEPIFTEEGEVPKVSVKYAKDSLAVKF
jgi:deoxyhypusine synthase